MTPKLPDTIKVTRHGSTVRLEVDGEEFPYAVADAPAVSVSRDEMPGVTVTLIADRVEVVDDLARGETPQTLKDFFA